MNHSKQLDVVHKRRAVFTVLARYLESDLLFRALWLWENNYSSEPVMAFLGTVCTSFDLQTRRNELRRDLLTILSSSQRDLAPDPMPSMLDHKEPDAERHQRYETERKLDINRNRVFVSVLSCFLNLLSQQQEAATSKVKTHLREQLPRLKMGASAVAELNRWLLVADGELRQPYSPDVLRSILNIAYIGACEHLGPVAADRSLAESVRVAETLPEAKAFAPREFL